jgi:hypothetical protein
MNRWRVGEDRGSKETDRCPLTMGGNCIESSFDLHPNVAGSIILYHHTQEVQVVSLIVKHPRASIYHVHVVNT